ncbi:hypothetical protein AAMO2058_001618200 [Amorphochlora amoebiformis]
MRRSRILAARKAAKKANLLTVRKANPKIIGNTAATTAPEAETLACDSKRAETEPQKENQNTSQGFQEKKDTSKATGPLHHKSKTSLVRRGLKRRFKKPHVVARSRVTISAGSTASISSNDETPRMIFRALYTKWSRKKHRNWDDAILIKKGNHYTLLSLENKIIVKRVVAGKKCFDEGSQFSIGSWDVEISSSVAEEEFMSGRLFISNADSAAKYVPLKKIRSGVRAKKQRQAEIRQARVLNLNSSSSQRRSKTQFRDIQDPEAVILNRDMFVADGAGGFKGEHPVMVDQYISRYLRPHQKEGVQFMYNAMTGRNGICGRGCILADSMGLGKTFQTICLLWTCLQTGPKRTPLCKKAIVVCPATLVKNWNAEFRKWLGTARIQPVVLNSGSDKSQLSDFLHAPTKRVLIIGYDLIRRHVKAIREGLKSDQTILVCDEGHRLKNSRGNKTIQALSSIGCVMKIILSGTPVQNDLMEFFAMCDFVNPGIFGSVNGFRNTFQTPISQSRNASATEEEIKVGDARSGELSRRTAPFVLRRTADILEKFLPPKVEQVIFTPMSKLQSKVYRAVLRSDIFNAGGHCASALQCITIMKKICNHPLLVLEFLRDKCNDDSCDINVQDALDCFPGHMRADAVKVFSEHSGKVAFLDGLLHEIVSKTNDKIVLVSNYSETLNYLEKLCKLRGYGTIRLDGKTKSSTRMSLVNRFNDPKCPAKVFLLSAKAGGVGLNLIGGNRLILFDPDWNPATDLQAMARVWRDGQKKVTWIYRLLSVGSVDEKIFQRQISKQEISSSVVDDEKDVLRNFKTEDLKKLFALNTTTKCETYDFLSTTQRKRQDSHQGWSFVDPKDRLLSDPLLESVAEENLSFIFYRKSGNLNSTAEQRP